MTYEQRMERSRNHMTEGRLNGQGLTFMRLQYLKEPIHRSSSLRGVMDLEPYSIVPEGKNASKGERK